MSNTKLLEIGGMKQDLAYRVKSINKKIFASFNVDKKPITVDEIIYLKHVNNMAGALIINRAGLLNFAYFGKSTFDLKDVIGCMELELAVDLALQKIKDLRVETRDKVKKLKKDYGL